MSNQTLGLSAPLLNYVRDVSLRESEVLKQLREDTARDPMARMQIAPEQGQFMALLVRLMNAHRALEIGVFTGYSALCVARALPRDGYLLACDVSEQWTTMARRYWRQAGVAEKIDLRLAPALETLDSLLDQGAQGSFDFAFIDADKVNYPAYLERSLALVRSNGLIAVDNTLWNGSVIAPEDNSADTLAIRAFNRDLQSDDRVDISLVPIGDGLTLARKR